MRRDPQASEDGAHGWVRGRHVGVRPKVDVEHGRVGALYEDALALGVGVVTVGDGVGGH